VPNSPAIPESLRQLMAELGPKWGTDVPGHVKRMVQAFSEVLAQAPADGVQVTRDLPYGTHVRHVLDVYQPGGVSGAPVVMFVHGGAFVDGEKDRSEQVYSNILRYFARNGLCGINLEFRNAPETKYPGGTEDVASALAWARENVSRYGGDPKRVFLMGHSAGGTHAGNYAYNRRFWPAGGHGLSGLIIVSGRMRIDNLPENPNARKVEAYFGTDQAVMEEGSPVNHVDAQSVPTFVAIAEYENPLLDVYCAELVAKLAAAKRRAPPHMWLRGHNHTSIIAHLNTAEDDLGRALLAFIRSPH
jgi:acetyl esterase